DGFNPLFAERARHQRDDDPRHLGVFDVTRDHAVGQLSRLQIPFQFGVGVFQILCLFHTSVVRDSKWVHSCEKSKPKTVQLLQLFLRLNGTSTVRASSRTSDGCNQLVLFFEQVDQIFLAWLESKLSVATTKGSPNKNWDFRFRLPRTFPGLFNLEFG